MAYIAAATSRESQLWGWEAFFDKIAVFLCEVVANLETSRKIMLIMP